MAPKKMPISDANRKVISLEDKIEINYIIQNIVRTYHKFSKKQYGVLICVLLCGYYDLSHFST